MPLLLLMPHSLFPLPINIPPPFSPFHHSSSTFHHSSSTFQYRSSSPSSTLSIVLEQRAPLVFHTCLYLYGSLCYSSRSLLFLFHSTSNSFLYLLCYSPSFTKSSARCSSSESPPPKWRKYIICTLAEDIITWLTFFLFLLTLLPFLLTSLPILSHISSSTSNSSSTPRLSLSLSVSLRLSLSLSVSLRLSLSLTVSKTVSKSLCLSLICLCFSWNHLWSWDCLWTVYLCLCLSLPTCHMDMDAMPTLRVTLCQCIHPHNTHKKLSC